MMRTKYILITTLAVGFTLNASHAHAQSSKIGINSAIKGDVKVKTGEQDFLKAKVTAPIFMGDGVNSANESSLQVLLLDETIFTVGPDCELTIDEFVYNPNATNNGLTSTVKKGAFRFMSGNISKSQNASVTIDTPVASMGVRGTIVEGLVGADAIRFARNAGVIPASIQPDTAGASLFILRGPGQNTDPSARRGAIDVTSAGQVVTVDQSGYATFVANAATPPVTPFPVSQALYAYMSEQLRASAPKNRIDDQSETYLDQQINPVTNMVWPQCQIQFGQC